MLRAHLFLPLVLLAGCPSSYRADDDAGAGDAPLLRDAADAADARAADARTDASRDAGVDQLTAVLTCGFDETIALEAIVRHVACLDRREQSSVDGFYEAWQAGLLSGLDSAFASFDPTLGCAAWRCLAEAASCDEAARCLPSAACAPTPACDGDVYVHCNSGTPGRFDCGSVGATCSADGCTRDDCTFKPGIAYVLACDGSDITLCDGAIRAACPTGTACASFAVSGEVPTVFCSPGGEPGYGAYGSPIVCADGVISFEGVAGEAVRYDCAGNGYSGCDEWGCLP
jgi:hypothetical protein